jgi:hypothetical protein
MSSYAVGKHAFGFCDRCGFRYPLRELREEVVNLALVNILVCPECWDPDQPQNQLGHVRIDESQALRNPRPPLGLAQSRQFINSASGSPLEIINPQVKKLTFSGERYTSPAGPWNSAFWSAKNIDGYMYQGVTQANYPPSIGEDYAISESGGILSCPWPPDTGGQSRGVTSIPLAYNGNTASLNFWDYMGGGGNPQINMSKNRYLQVKMRVTDWGYDYPAIYASDDPWHGFVFIGVTPTPEKAAYPWGTGNDRFAVGMYSTGNPGFTGDPDELNVWKYATWDLMDDSAGESGQQSSWVESAALGFNVTTFSLPFFKYPDSTGDQAKVAFDIEYIKFLDQLNKYDFSVGTATSYIPDAHNYYGINNWVYTRNALFDNPASQMEWNESSSTVSLSIDVETAGYTQLIYDKIRNPSAVAGVDTSEYKVCTMRIRRTSAGGRPDSDVTWEGVFWFRLSPGGALYGGSAVATEPDWDAAGDDWSVIRWDMSNNEDWNSVSVITGWEFRLQTFVGTGAYPEYELDWVKFLPA